MLQFYDPTDGEGCQIVHNYLYIIIIIVSM